MPITLLVSTMVSNLIDTMSNYFVFTKLIYI